MYSALVLAVATPKCVQWDATHGPSIDRLAALQSVQTVQIVKLFPPPPWPSLMKCNSRTVKWPTRSFTIRTDCTDRQIVLLPDQQIDAYNYQTVNGSTTTFSLWQTVQIVWSIWQTVSVRLYWTWVDLFTVGVNGTEVSIYVKENFADALQREKKHLTRKMLRVCQNKETAPNKDVFKHFSKVSYPMYAHFHENTFSLL